MEEIEVPVEKLQDDIHEIAEHNRHEERQLKWISGVALSSAIFAALAAVSALLSGHHSNEAMIDQIRSSDHWSHYQAKGIKAAILTQKIEILQILGKNVSEHELQKAEEYKKQQDEITQEAKESENESKHHLQVHETLARSVTLFQVAIAVAAISALMRKRSFWFLSMGFGAIGLFFFILGLRI